MEPKSFLKALLLTLAVFVLGFVTVFAPFFFSNVREDMKEINTVSQDVAPVVPETPSLPEIFNPLDLKWKLVRDLAPFEKRDAHHVVGFSGKLWLLGGVGGRSPDYSKNYSDIWSSPDGENWTLITSQAPWGPRRAGKSFVFKNKLWILGGVTTAEKYLNDVWYSEGGSSWKLATGSAAWLPRKGFAAVVFKDKMWVVGGATTKGAANDAWYSENGVDWILANEKNSWTEKYDLAIEAFLGKMWLSGGAFPGGLGEKEVWYSEDGFSWQKTSGEIPWPGRHGHCFLSSNGYLWIIGGWSGYAHGYNDVWYSKDGFSWQALYEDGSAPFAGREDLECVDFDNKIFMTGGMKTNGERTNDVWVLSK